MTIARKWPVARARTRPTPGAMNKTEEAYLNVLRGLKAAEHIQDYWFEGVKLRLADSTFYTADFMVLNKVGEVELHEIKGHWEDDARVKIKVAASLYPFRFVGVTYKKGVWSYEEF